MKNQKRNQITATSTTAKAPGTAPGKPFAGTPPPHQEIAERAYYLYLSQGCPCGQSEQHWREAEAQLTVETHLEIWYSTPEVS